MPARSSAMRAISRAPTSTLRPKLNAHCSRSATLRSRNSPAPRISSATYRGASARRSSGRILPSSQRIRISIGSSPSSAYFGFRTRGGTSTKSTGLPRPRAYSIASLLESDLLISDWSAMAIEYALGLGKPVLFVDVPPRVRNPKYAELGLEPMEMRIRRELGRILPLDRLADAPRYVAELIRGAGEFRERSVALREQWAFNFGRSVEVGAREIARIADERAGIGALGIAR